MASCGSNDQGRFFSFSSSVFVSPSCSTKLVASGAHLLQELRRHPFGLDDARQRHGQVLLGRQPSHVEAAQLSRPPERDEARAIDPLRRVRREDDDGVVADRSLVVAGRAADSSRPSRSTEPRRLRRPSSCRSIGVSVTSMPASVIFFSAHSVAATLTNTRCIPFKCVTSNVQSSRVSDGTGPPPIGEASNSTGMAAHADPIGRRVSARVSSSNAILPAQRRAVGHLQDHVVEIVVADPSLAPTRTAWS